MSTLSKVFTTDVGTKIILDTGQDLSTVSAKSIKAKNPVTGIWETLTATVVETTKLQHDKTASTLNVAGNWRLSAYVEFSADKYHGDPVILTVFEIS